MKKLDPFHIAVLLVHSLFPDYLLVNWVGKSGHLAIFKDNRLTDEAKRYMDGSQLISDFQRFAMISFGAIILCTFFFPQTRSVNPLNVAFMSLIVIAAVLILAINKSQKRSFIVEFGNSLDDLLDLLNLELASLLTTSREDLTKLANDKLVSDAVSILNSEAVTGVTSETAEQFRVDFKRHHAILLRFGLVAARANQYFEEAQTELQERSKRQTESSSAVASIGLVDKVF